jgi:hypothetical protein
MTFKKRIIGPWDLGTLGFGVSAPLCCFVEYRSFAMYLGEGALRELLP